MIMNLTCPKCGNKFEIEESHEAKEKQYAALDKQKKLLERNFQERLTEREQQLVEKQDLIVETEVKKGITNKIESIENDASKKYKNIYQQEFDEKIFKVKREANEKIKKADSIHEYEMKRIKDEVSNVNANANRHQAVQLVGESAEIRLKKELKNRFLNDEIINIQTGQSGADIEHYVNIQGSSEHVGLILIERKSTKVFLKSWIDKFKKEVEKSNATIGVIVTDSMPKEHKDNLYFSHSSKIKILRADVVIDMIAIIRENLIRNYREEVAERATQDNKVTVNVFKFISGEGKEYLEDFQMKLLERKKLLEERDKNHKRIMKKEMQNLREQSEAFNKFGMGLNKTSNKKVNIIGKNIEIEGPLD